MELLLEGIKQQSKDDLYQMWLNRYVIPIHEQKDYVEWKDFYEKAEKEAERNKNVNTTKKTSAEAIANAEDILEMVKRSRNK